AGFSYYYPVINAQYALTKDISIGIEPMFASYGHNDGLTSSSISAVGAYVTGSYYYTHSCFRGLIFSGGLGLINISGSAGPVTDKSTAIAMRGTVGWRGKALWDLGLDIGVEGGLQYIGYSSSTLNITFSGILPMVTAFVGYSF